MTHPHAHDGDASSQLLHCHRELPNA
jgi:hypothetical protein